MSGLEQLFEGNRKWAEQNQDLHGELAKGQSPKVLWIGCADSRVPPSEIMGLDPGQLFVHRNVANLVLHNDLNCLSVLQFAIQYLKVEHVVVCGHYSCGGVQAAMQNQKLGLIDNWLREVRDLYGEEREALEAIGDEEARWRRLVELNVERQVQHVAETTVVESAWERGQNLTLHGWVYDISTGLLKDLECSTSKSPH